jgi:hypothetical protein
MPHLTAESRMNSMRSASECRQTVTSFPPAHVVRSKRLSDGFGGGEFLSGDTRSRSGAARTPNPLRCWCSSGSGMQASTNRGRWSDACPSHRRRLPRWHVTVSFSAGRKCPERLIVRVLLFKPSAATVHRCDVEYPRRIVVALRAVNNSSRRSDRSCPISLAYPLPELWLPTQSEHAVRPQCSSRNRHLSER